MNQKDVVFQLMTDGWLSSRRAFNESGCTRLAAVVKKFEREGHTIERRWKTDVDRYGNQTHYKEYRIKEAAK